MSDQFCQIPEMVFEVHRREFKTLASAVELFGNAKAWLLTNTDSEFFEVVLRATERLQTRITEARK